MTSGYKSYNKRLTYLLTYLLVNVTFRLLASYETRDVFHPNGRGAKSDAGCLRPVHGKARVVLRWMRE